MRLGRDKNKPDIELAPDKEELCVGQKSDETSRSCCRLTSQKQPLDERVMKNRRTTLALLTLLMAGAPLTHASAKGLGDSANDAELVASARAVLECEEKWNWQRSCEAYKTWKTNSKLKSGAADATLINLLSDENPRARWLGAVTLRMESTTWRSDAASVRALIEAAGAESDKKVSQELGRAIAKANAKKSGSLKSIITLIKSHPGEDLQVELASGFLVNNTSLEAHAAIIEVARTHERVRVRRAAVDSLWGGTTKQTREATCEMWLVASGDADRQLAAKSSKYLGWYASHGGCPEHHGALLDRLGERAASGAVDHSDYSSALSFLHKNKHASAAHKERCVVVAKAVVEGVKNNASARSSALKFIGQVDPDASGFAKKFVDDKESFVAGAAKRIIEK